MIRSRLALVVLVLGLIAPSAHAQAAPATLEYTYNVALAEVQTYAQTVTVNGAAVTGTPACVATSATLTTCTLTLPSLPTTTSSTIVIAATKGGVTSETRVTGLDLSKIPANASTPKVKVTVTVTIG